MRAIWICPGPWRIAPPPRPRKRTSRRRRASSSSGRSMSRLDPSRPIVIERSGSQITSVGGRPPGSETSQASRSCIAPQASRPIGPASHTATPRRAGRPWPTVERDGGVGAAGMPRCSTRPQPAATPARDGRPRGPGSPRSPAASGQKPGRPSPQPRARSSRIAAPARCLASCRSLLRRRLALGGVIREAPKRLALKDVRLLAAERRTHAEGD